MLKCLGSSKSNIFPASYGTTLWPRKIPLFSLPSGSCLFKKDAIQNGVEKLELTKRGKLLHRRYFKMICSEGFDIAIKTIEKQSSYQKCSYLKA